MNFSNLLSKMVVLFIFMLVGFICGRTGMIDEHARIKFNKLVLYICAPSLILSSALGSQLSYSTSDIFLLMLYATLYLAVLMVLAILVVFLLRVKGKERGIFLFCCVFGNVMFMGFPVIASLYGDDAVFLLSVTCVPFNFLLYSLGIYLITGNQEGTAKINWKAILTNPALPATLLAFVFFLLQFRLPAAIEDALSYLGNMVIPLAMMLIGVSLSTVSFKEIFRDKKVYIYCFIKLIIEPLLIFFLLRPLVSDQLFFGIIVVECAMPTASICPIFCTEYGSNTVFASKMVFLSTLCSLVTIPLIVSLLLL